MASYVDDIVEKYIVRVVCEGKSMYLELKDSELNTKSFPEKGELFDSMFGLSIC